MAIALLSGSAGERAAPVFGRRAAEAAAKGARKDFVAPEPVCQREVEDRLFAGRHPGRAALEPQAQRVLLRRLA
ncbi:MAG TPA: hypothetical protein VFY39_12600 [Gammaproteobacteria bacterium]|nr:hypothetical protein [Gammaproteobacteria bacterium]